MDAASIAAALAGRPEVTAVALAGSRGAATADAESDTDLYVYCNSDPPVALRRRILGHAAEIDNRFFETGDECRDAATGQRFDIMYRRPEWIEDQLERVLVRHEAWLGYSTCFWFNVLHSTALFDRDGWYAALQERARTPYPEALRRAIVAKNLPLLGRNQSSYRRQIELALGRDDAFSVNHRLTAMLASFFDIWFALERQPHPGEKRLLTWLPADWAADVRAVLDAKRGQLLARIDHLLQRLSARVVDIQT